MTVWEGRWEKAGAPRQDLGAVAVRWNCPRAKPVQLLHTTLTVKAMQDLQAHNDCRGGLCQGRDCFIRKTFVYG